MSVGHRYGSVEKLPERLGEGFKPVGFRSPEVAVLSGRDAPEEDRIASVGSNIQAREPSSKFACRLPVQGADGSVFVDPVPVEAATGGADVRLEAELTEGVESLAPIEIEHDEPTHAARDHRPGLWPILRRPLVELLATWDHRLVLLPGEERTLVAHHRNARPAARLRLVDGLRSPH